MIVIRFYFIKFTLRQVNELFFTIYKKWNYNFIKNEIKSKNNLIRILPFLSEEFWKQRKNTRIKTKRFKAACSLEYLEKVLQEEEDA